MNVHLQISGEFDGHFGLEEWSISAYGPMHFAPKKGECVIVTDRLRGICTKATAKTVTVEVIERTTFATAQDELTAAGFEPRDYSWSGPAEAHMIAHGAHLI